jgi:hypothetical protein
VRPLEALRDLEEPTIRDRPVGVLLVATASAIAGSAVVLAAIEVLAGAAKYGDWAKPKLVGNDFVGQVQVYPEHYLLMGALLVLPASFLVAFAIGLFRARGWAWILGLVAGGLLTAYGILALVIPAEASHDESKVVADRWYAAAGLPWLLIGVALLWYFNRRVVMRDLGLGDPAIG